MPACASVLLFRQTTTCDRQSQKLYQKLAHNNTALHREEPRSSEDAVRCALPAQAGFRWQCRLVGCLFVLHHNAAGNRVAFLVFAEGDGLLREGNLDA